MRRLLTLLPALFLAVNLVAQSSPTKSSQVQSTSERALSEIKPEVLRAHMAFLADDLLEGRGTATRGQEIAGAYIATEFASYGLKPAGDNGSYIQRVPLRQVTVQPERCELVLKRGAGPDALTWGDDFIMSGDALRENTNVEAPVVFVGYGITAPDQNYDDYAGVDVRGKIVAILFGAPPKFSSETRAHYGDSLHKIRNASERGAIGVLGLATPDVAKILPWERFVSSTKSPSFRWLDAKGVPNDTFSQIHGAAFLSMTGAKRLLAPKSFDEIWATAQAGKPQSFELAGTVRIHVTSRHKDVTSPNVAALLTGSDPRLKSEYVVFSAHTDHLGIGESINGDTIYNGAVDNASGTAALLNLAEAFSRLPKAPARSIVFLGVTGEEAGLLGSDYYAHYPTVPRDSIVANINMDGVIASYDFGDIIAYGAEHSSLEAAVRRSAARMKVKVSPDPMPEQVFFVRSDQYPFVRQGVPAVMVSVGLQAVDPKVDGRKLFENWIQKYYHSPFDDMKQPLNFQAMTKYTKLVFLLGSDVANAPVRPAWNKGDFFGETFSRKAKAPN